MSKKLTSEQRDTLTEQVLSNFGEPVRGEQFGGNHVWTVPVNEKRNGLDIHPCLNSVGDDVHIYAWVDLSRVYIAIVVDDVKTPLCQVPIGAFNSKVVGAIVESYVVGYLELKKKIAKIFD
jgi:hypothetical protein